MSFKDYYDILGLKSNKATINEIKLAYREQAKKYHPDMHIEDNYSEDRFKDINEAYKILSDIKARRKYDGNWHTYTERKKRLENREKEEKKTFKEKLMDILFGIGFQKEKQTTEKPKIADGENIDTEVEVTVLEAFNGSNKKLKLRTVDGKTRTFNLNIQPGIQNGDKIRFVGQGKPGKNGGKNGDLLVKVTIKDTAEFKLNGVDIYKEVNITPWEAALGTKLKVQSIDAEISLILPKGTQSGQCFTIKEKGYKFGVGARGNFYIITRIVVPIKLTKEEEELYTKLKELQTKKINDKVKKLVNK